jgi:hypothetical protein
MRRRRWRKTPWSRIRRMKIPMRRRRRKRK